MKPEWFGLPSGEDLTPAQATLPSAAGVPVGRGLVAGLLDPAVSPRAGAAGRRRCRRVSRQRCCRSGPPSIGWSRPAVRCAGIARRS